MIKLLVWLAGDCALLYAVDRMGLWHAIIAAAVLVCSVLWILGGAVVIGHGLSPRTARPAAPVADMPGLRERAERAAAARAGSEAAK